VYNHDWLDQLLVGVSAITTSVYTADCFQQCYTKDCYVCIIQVKTTVTVSAICWCIIGHSPKGGGGGGGGGREEQPTENP